MARHAERYAAPHCAWRRRFSLRRCLRSSCCSYRVPGRVRWRRSDVRIRGGRWFLEADPFVPLATGALPGTLYATFVLGPPLPAPLHPRRPRILRLDCPLGSLHHSSQLQSDRYAAARLTSRTLQTVAAGCDYFARRGPRGWRSLGRRPACFSIRSRFSWCGRCGGGGCWGFNRPPAGGHRHRLRMASRLSEDRHDVSSAFLNATVLSSSNTLHGRSSRHAVASPSCLNTRVTRFWCELSAR